ncbi:MAG: hypothetical protein HXX09_09630 [Bacteroidetes bacterium]|nr:hypothetical protein [Bacteroidota bacterium]
MILIKAFLLLLLLITVLIPFFNVKGKGIVTFIAILLNTLISSYFAFLTFLGEKFEFILPGSIVSGLIPLRIDALSGWFMMVINIVFITGGFYGFFYMNNYKSQKNNLSLHSISFVFLHAALISLCVIQNSIAFIVAWEIMALSAFILIIFEHGKITTLKAGINYLIQSHISIVFLMLGFMWMAFKTGTYDFAAISTYTATHDSSIGIILFLCFFVTFAIKAGFVPFHTWLPYAHPAAPAHISGIMSGVIIKIGIFGILRMLLLIKPDFTIIGYIILIVSLISGLYGVMLAIIQHNLKKLLAYHSIENIGIIGIGIGLGCIGLGSENIILASIGFAGALLHTLNHALFKSLLFYTAGNVYLATHTLDIEHLGGLIKKMPQTTLLFLIAAIAICGIPPFNGFISEFLIYNGLYSWLHEAKLASLVMIIFSILGLVMIGGLAMLCFTKAFGVVFLGSPRHQFKHEIKEVPFKQLFPLYLIAALIISIGLFPKLFLNLMMKPVSLYTGIQQASFIPLQGPSFDAIQSLSYAAWGFVLLIGGIFLIRKLATRKRIIETSPTWGCGYIAPNPKLQYTANSFVRSFIKLFKPILVISKKEHKLHGIFPSEETHYETHPYDGLEKQLIDNPLKSYKSFMGRFLFLQNGKLQFYILYGIIFIILVIGLPLIYEKIIELMNFFKQL